MAFNKIADNNTNYPLTLNTLRVDGTLTSSGTGIFTGGTQSTVSLIARQSQTSTGQDIQQWQQADGFVFGRVNPQGEFLIGQNGATMRIGASTGMGGSLTIGASGPTYIGLSIRGATSHTANLTEWQSIGGTVGAKVDASMNIFTNSYYGINAGNLTTNSFGIVYNNGTSPSVSAEASVSTNAGFPTPVMLPNEDGYYPYWSFKTPNVVETSADGTNWTSIDPTGYRSLFTFQGGSGLNVTTRAIRFTFYQPTFTFLALIMARLVGGPNGKNVTMKTETLASNYSTVLFTWGPTTGVSGYDGAALVQNINEYAGNIYATRVTLEIPTWTVGDTFTISNLMAYLSKPGTGFGFQNKFPMSWDTNKAITLQTNNPGSPTLLVKAATTLSSTITAATANGTTITYTTSSQHGFLTGHVLNITGIVSTGNPSATAGTGFNISAATVASVISQTQFTVTNSLVDTYTSGGTAAVGQGADIMRWQDGGGTSLITVASNGTLNVSSSGTIISAVNGRGIFVTNSASAVAMTVKGAAAQTADLQQWQNSAGTVVASINNSGIPVFTVGTFVNDNATSNVGLQVKRTLFQFGTVATEVGAIVKGATSQSADLQQWQDSTGAVLASVLSNGVIKGAEIRTNSTQGVLREVNGGGNLYLRKTNSLPAAPGTDIGTIYFRDGTNAGTLKLVVRAGASGAETTILDNIPQT